MIRCTHENTKYNAHQDDIHGMVLLPGNQILASGSKDGTAKLWNFPSLTPISSSDEGVGKINYQKWVTAISACSNDSFFIGTRDGRVEKHELSGRKISLLSHETEDEIEGCKERNQSRINCLTGAVTKLFVGIATGFFEYDLNEKTQISFCKTHDRDWVYCLHPLESDKILTVTGRELSIFQKRIDQNWEKLGVIQGPVGRQPAAFISSITPINGTNNTVFATANFDGSVRLQDINRGQELDRYSGHEGRVWQVVNTFSPDVIASCADDATILLFDIRQKKNSLTINGSPGRVSALVSCGNLIASGSCPDRLKNAESRAMISIWDIRQNSGAVQK